ncbi:MAG: AAA family ATPase [Pseudomonadota bacterium]
MLKIQKVEVTNYKCIGNIKAELHPFTVLIGPNDSGKTSFMEAIHLVSRLANEAGKATPLHDLSLWPLGRKTIQSGKARNEKIGISIECILDGKKSTYKILLNPDNENKRYYISEESLSANGTEIKLFVDNQNQYKISANGKVFGNYGEVTHRPYGVEESIFKFREQYGDSLGVSLSSFQQMSFFHFNPDGPAKQSKADEAQEFSTLKKDGYGLPSLLANLALNDRNRIIKIEEDLKTITDGRIVSIATPQSDIYVNQARQLAYSIVFVTENGLRIPADQISTGILYALCILTLVHYPDPPSVIFLEEPENSVHPSRLREIVKFLKMLATRTDGPSVQIIAATHSPYLLDFCEPGEVLVFKRDRKSGLATASHVDGSAVKEKEWALSLGEIWGSYEEDGLLTGKVSKEK